MALEKIKNGVFLGTERATEWNCYGGGSGGAKVGALADINLNQQIKALLFLFCLVLSSFYLILDKMFVE